MTTTHPHKPIKNWPTSPEPNTSNTHLHAEWVIRRPDGSFWRSPIDQMVAPESAEPTTFGSRHDAEVELHSLLSEVSDILGRTHFPQPRIVVQAVRINLATTPTGESK